MENITRTELPKANIDKLVPHRGLIDLTTGHDGNFGLEGFELSFLFDDILLVEFIDCDESGDSVMRNGVYIPVNTMTKAWRKARVILAGPHVAYSKKGDIIMFPNDKGLLVSNILVTDHGLVKKGMFLNEQRAFGLCKYKS